jgi:hypothetical protein
MGLELWVRVISFSPLAYLPDKTQCCNAFVRYWMNGNEISAAQVGPS